MTPGNVHAWFAETSVLADDEARRARAFEWLTSDERARAGRYRHDRDRLMFVMGRVMARRLVGNVLGIAPTAWTWGEGPRGRPEIGSPTTPLHFNLAHSAGFVCCVLASDREVGIDVEDLDRAATDPAVVPRFCSPDEAATIRVGQPGWRERFLEVWTLKEAYLKARGMGISVQLADISFSTGAQGPTVRGFEGPKVRFVGSLAGTDDRWAFQLFLPTPRHLLAIAASTADGADPQFALWPFPADWLP